MALSNFSELKTSIADWLDRDDVTTIIPDFIALAEARINATLRVRRMENVVQMTLIKDQKRYALPTDYLSMRGLKFSSTKIKETTLVSEISKTDTSIALTSATGFTTSGTILIGSEQITYSGISTDTLTGCVRGANDTTPAIHVALSEVFQIYTSWTAGTSLSDSALTLYSLKYVAPEILTSIRAGSQQGVPTVYTMSAGHILIGPVPASTYTAEMVYFQKIPALSDAAPTNWCLTANPQLFLYGSLIEAMPYLQDEARINTFVAGFDRAMQDLQQQDDKDQFSGSELRILNTSGYY